MDLAPPTDTATSVDTAADAATRVIDMERWLAAQQAGVPRVPDAFGPGTLGTFIDSIDTFWDAARRASLAGRLSSAMLDLADLQARDGTLAAAEHALARRVASLGLAADGVTLREVMFGDAPFAGAIIVEAGEDTGGVLSFVPDAGWRGHASLDAAHQDIETRARRYLTDHLALPGVADAIDPTTGDLRVVRSRPLPGVPFETLAGAIVATQRGKVVDAGIRFELDPAAEGRIQRLADDLRDATRLTDVFDVGAILALRDAQLEGLADRTRMAGVPASLAARWHRTRAELAAARRIAAERLRQVGATAVPELMEYTLVALGGTLAKLGMQDDPASITLALDRSANSLDRVESLGSLVSGPMPVRTSLVEAAWQGLPLLDGGRLSAYDQGGRRIATLDDATIRALVNAVDIHASYTALVTQAFRDGATARLRRQATSQVLAARMHHDAAEARVATHRGEHGSAAYLGLGEPGARWVGTAVDAAAGNTPRRGHHGDITARQVTYQGSAMRDIIVIAPRDTRRARGEPWAVFYTPDAPDGVAFREFASEADAERHFLRAPAFREYLLDRLPAAFAEPWGEHGARRFKANRQVHFVFNTGYPQGYTDTAAPFVLRHVADNLLDATFDASFAHALDTIRAHTRSAADAQAALRLHLWRASPVQGVPAALLLGIATAPFRVLPPALRAYDAVKAGDSALGLVEATESYVAALGAYPTAATAGSVASHALLRFRAANGSLVSRAMARAPARFQASAGARPAGAQTQAGLNGLYRIDGERYAVIDGVFYPAHYDAFNRTLRLGGLPLEGKAAGEAIRLVQGFWRPARQSSQRYAGAASPQPAAASSTYADYCAQMEQAFPDAAQRERVSREMFVQRWTSRGGRLISAAERERFDAIVSGLQARVRASTGVGPSLPGRLRAVEPHYMPEWVYAYMPAPLDASAFLRSSSDPATAWGALQTSWQADGVAGIRVASVPPTAGLRTVMAAMGTAYEPHASLFAIALRPRDIAGADLLSLVGGDGTQYVLRGRQGRPIMLEPGRFRVHDFVPR